MQISMYLSTQLHYTQNVDDNSLSSAGYQSSNAASWNSLSPSSIPSLWRSNRVLAFPSLYIRHFTSRRGFSVGQKQPPPHSSAVFLHLHILLRFFPRRDFTTFSHSLSLPFSASLSLFFFYLIRFFCRSSRLGKIISFIAIPLLRFHFMYQTMECSFLGARGHADSTNDNKSSAKDDDLD